MAPLHAAAATAQHAAVGAAPGRDAAPKKNGGCVPANRDTRSGVQAKVLASRKRKEAMKEAVAKLREKGKEPADAASTTKVP
ncbi:hypothetical protein TRIUR3_03050 [Triticum urartu]|uniref:Uncharacterized protein n=1 Tax=Triticum urartu TaxID=4572 RepID=M7ZTA1_TRIUA|nr:hypothetical protein TRIUR3_03050 [Triticum urartu]